jgi:hypothetical protein
MLRIFKTFNSGGQKDDGKKKKEPKKEPKKESKEKKQASASKPRLRRTKRQSKQLENPSSVYGEATRSPSSVAPKTFAGSILDLPVLSALSREINGFTQSGSKPRFKDKERASITETPEQEPT